LVGEQKGFEVEPLPSGKFNSNGVVGGEPPIVRYSEDYATHDIPNIERFGSNLVFKVSALTPDILLEFRRNILWTRGSCMSFGIIIAFNTQPR
jgi:hypothetical protein